MNLTGIHHLTAITADAPGNNRFYTDTLGLRRVKKTVNQDDTSAYHLFFADGAGSLRHRLLTFFDWPVARERRGTHSISRAGLRVDEASLDYWRRRAGPDAGRDRHARRPREPRFRGSGGPALPADRRPVGRGASVGAEPGAGRAPDSGGLGPITISVPDLAPTEAVLTRVMNMARVRDYASPDSEVQVHVFEIVVGGRAAELHVAVQPGLPVARQGAGAVHHVAFRVPDAAAIHDWAERLNELRVPSSGEVERYYFRSLYFREPNGILFEIASDTPGFAVDEPFETMGELLSLPPFLEPRLGRRSRPG